MSDLTSATSIDAAAIHTELQTLLGPEPYVIHLPNTIEGITDTLLKYRRSPVQYMAVRLRRTPSDPVTEEQYRQLAAFLAAMYNLEMIDPQMK